MKKYIFFAGILAGALLLSIDTQAQKPENGDKKTKEVIIRKSGDKDTKMTIEINGDSITINGKPLSEYKDDDVSVLKRDFRGDRSRNFLWSPDIDGENEVNVFDNNDVFPGEPRTFLGVITDKTTDGVKITSVVKGSAAEKAGLQKEDVITGVNDKKITSPDGLMEVIRSYKPNDNVKIDYLRDSKKKDIKVKLGETKEKSRAFFFQDDNHNMNGDGFNFKMPKMPKMPNYNYNYNYKLRNNGHPKLGLKIEDTENDDGAKILNVEEGSAGDKAGLKKDDIITEINGDKVTNVEELQDHLNDTEDKDVIHLKAKRNSSEMNFDVKFPKKLNKADL